MAPRTKLWVHQYLLLLETDNPGVVLVTGDYNDIPLVPMVTDMDVKVEAWFFVSNRVFNRSANLSV